MILQMFFTHRPVQSSGPITFPTLGSPGYVMTVGYNAGGVIGDSIAPVSPYITSIPYQVGALTNWSQIYLGSNTAKAIKTDGTLWMWGNNNSYYYGDGTYVNRSSPIQIGSLTNWKTLSSSIHSLAIKTDGTLWSWGPNWSAQLGNGTLATVSTPVQIGTLTNWSTISGGYNNSAAIKTNGTLWTWGGNDYGQLGVGNVTPRSSPVQVGALTNWRSVTVGVTVMAGIKTDGTLWTWGNNTNGELGIGTTTAHVSSPVQVGSATNWRMVCANPDSTIAGSDNLYAIKTDGTLWVWGIGSNGSLGLGSTMPWKLSSPTQIGSLTNWSTVVTSQYSTFAIKTDGTLWGWGINTNYNISPTAGNIMSPIQIGSLTTWQSIAAGAGTFAGIHS